MMKIHEKIADAAESATKAISNLIRAVEDGHVTADELPAILVWADKAKSDIDIAVAAAREDSNQQSWANAADR